MIQCVSSKLLIVSAGRQWGCAGLACAEALVSSGFICDPLPTPQCRASTIAETPEGWWPRGSAARERHQDVGIWLARRENGAWLPAREVANGVQPDGTRHPCWNPVLHTAKDGSLTLFFGQAGLHMVVGREDGLSAIMGVRGLNRSACRTA